MKIFPIIDIKDKKCVRLVKGDFVNKVEFLSIDDINISRRTYSKGLHSFNYP
tara:strand:- start:79 stop:234 length:156 start_codon:yes stop_codon:yes gene_type:complete